MSKTRLVGLLALVASLAVVAVWTSGATAKPQGNAATIKLGLITKFPVDFFFVLQNAAKKWDKATPGATECRCAPSIRSGGKRPLVAVSLAPIRFSGSATRSTGRRRIDSSPSST